MFIKILKAFISFFCLLVAFYTHAQINPYHPPQNMQKIPIGSYIIGMDNTTQPTSDGKSFNIKAYGLVNRLLDNGIQVKWIINSNKSNLTEPDLLIQAQREFPSPSTAANYAFLSGPFVIDSIDAAAAKLIIQQYSNSVNVYKTTALANGDVYFILKSAPFIGVLIDGGNSSFHKSILDNAGFTSPDDYNLISAKELSASSCYTFVSESNDNNNIFGNTALTGPLKNFVLGGGSFFAQSKAALAYENTIHFLSPMPSNMTKTSTNSMSVKNPSHPFIQTDGTIYSTGEGFKFTPTPNPLLYSVIEDPGTPVSYLAFGGVPAPSSGYVFYFSETPGAYTWTENTSINVFRMYLNAALMPIVVRSSSTVCSSTDIDIKATPSNKSYCLYDTFSIKIKASNLGYLTANNLAIKVNPVSGVSFIDAVASSGSFNNSTNTWNISSISTTKADSVLLRYKAISPGTSKIVAYSQKLSNDSKQQNDTSSVTFTIQSMPGINAGKDTTICKGSSVRLGSDSLSGYTYEWKSSNGQIVSNTAHLTVTPLLPVSYTLNKTSTSTGCRASDTVQITIADLPIFDLGPDKEVCYGEHFIISLPEVEGRSYSWSSSPAGFSSSGFAIDIIPSNTIKVYALGTDPSSGCSSRDSITITVTFTGPSTSSIINSDTTTYLSSKDISAIVPTQGTGMWSVIEGKGSFEDPFNASTKVSNLAIGKNILRWTISLGTCPPSFHDLTIIVKDLVIPQGFSPNGDGINDFFVVEGIEAYPESKLEILTRWGEIVYAEDKYNNNWKGQNNKGEKLPDDTYYFILHLSEGRTFKSYILLQR